jgi:hypothetical protein
MAVLSPGSIVAGLVQRGVPEHVARGVVMNFQDESGLNTGIQEQAPTSGRGGFGLAQWTGPRRVALEQFAQSQGKSIDDPDLQLDYFMSENSGPEAAAWQQVMAAPTAQDAAVAFVNKWERPAAEHAASRSAKYTNASDSPSEGGARFGGTGLDKANPVDPSKALPAQQPQVAKAGDRDKYATAMSKGIGGFAAMQAPTMGGSDGRLPSYPQESYPTEAMPIVSGGTDRNAMAMLMARLNSGQLWV